MSVNGEARAIQLHPLQLNPNINEPFLRLPVPYDNIILTPFRTSDANALTVIMNDEHVYPWLRR
jgi:hypothetical protein